MSVHETMAHAPGRVLITPPGRLNLPRWGEIWEAREIVYRFAQRDVLLRYRQTFVGVAWVVLQPLATAGIFSIVFGRVAALPSDGVPYFLFSFASMLVWGLFGNVITRGGGSLVASQQLISKVFFPRLLIPVGAVMAALVDFVVSLALFVVLLVRYDVSPGLPALLFPAWFACTLLLGGGLALACSAVMVKFRDVGYVITFLLQILLFATPVAYSLNAVPDHYRWAFEANPVTWLMEVSRWSMLGLSQPPTWQILALVLTSLGTFAAGLLWFQRLERGFADVI